MGDVAPIDWDALHKRCLNDADFVREMTAVFKTHAVETHRKLHAALTAADLPAATKYAHTLKGSAANLSAEPLRDAAYTTENECRSANLNAALAAGTAVDRLLRQTIAEIDNALPR